MTPLLVPLFSLLALAIASLLWRQTAGHGGLPGCGPRSACAAVTRSRWGRVGPAPVALFGVITYLLMTVAAIGAHPLVAARLPSSIATGMTAALLAASLAAAGAGVWFIAVQAIALQRFCRYCLYAHGLAIAVAAMAVNGRPAGTSLVLPGAIAGGLVLLLIAGQLLLRAKSYAVTGVGLDERVACHANPDVGIAVGSVTTTAAADADDLHAPPVLPVVPLVAAVPEVPPARRVVLAGGNVTAAVSEWPIVGSPDARHVLMLLFDHTCSTCRDAYRVVIEAVGRAGHGNLAVLCVPVPQSAACNPNVGRGNASGRADACSYARLALCLHDADPSTSTAFERWALQSPDAPCFAPALARANELTPRLADIWPPGPRMEHRLRAGIGFYKSARATQVPVLLLPQSAVGGLVPSAVELLKLLDRELGLRNAQRSLPPQGRPVVALEPRAMSGGGGFDS